MEIGDLRLLTIRRLGGASRSQPGAETEALTQSRVLVLGDSLSDFMRELGIYSSCDGKAYTRLRNQMASG